MRGPVLDGGHREDFGVFYVMFDPDTDRVSTMVAKSVAAIQNRQLEELDPVFDAIEPDALDNLIGSDEEEPGVDEVQFSYEGTNVTFEPDGILWLRYR